MIISHDRYHVITVDRIDRVLQAYFPILANMCEILVKLATRIDLAIG